MKYGFTTAQKYNTFKYGVTADAATWQWIILVDWDGNGLFDEGDNEASYARGMTIRRGREFYLSTDQGFEPIRAGEISITLDNSTRRYDPYYASGPLYGLIKPGRLLQVKIKYNTTPYTTYTLFTGVIDDIQPSYGDDKVVTITGRDMIDWLKLRDVADVLYQNIEVATALTNLLISAGWSDTGFTYAIDDNADTVPWYWAGENSVIQAIQNLSDAYMGKPFIAADGTFKYYSRHRAYTDTLALDQSEILKTIPIPQPWEVVRNMIEVRAFPRAIQATSVLWDISAPIPLSNLDVYEVWADYSYDGDQVPATSVVSPVATTDYLFNSQADGLGTNLTSSLGVVATIYGTKAKITLTNNAGVLGYVTMLQIRGDALPQASRFILRAEDETSKAAYLPRLFLIDTDIQQDPNVAADFAAYLLTWLKDPKLYPYITLQTVMDKQFAVDLYDQVALTVAQLGINDQYLVSYIEHEWLNDTGQDVMTQLILEQPLDISDYWTFSTNIGTTSIFGF